MSKRKGSNLSAIGLVLLVVGVIVLGVGIYQLVQFNSSFGGKLSNKAANLFGTHSQGVEQPIIMMICGAAAAAAGFVLYKKRSALRHTPQLKKAVRELKFLTAFF
jgi:uncharacterized membrane protein (Fun14 family)